MNKQVWFIFTFFLLFVISALSWFALSSVKEESLKAIQSSLQTVTKTSHEALKIWVKHRQRNIKDIAKSEQLILLTQQLISTYSNANGKIVGNEAASKVLEKLRCYMKAEMKVNSDIGFFVISKQNINMASMRDSNLYEVNVISQKRPSFFKRLFAGETLFIPPINSDVPIQIKSGEFVENLPTIFIGTPIFNNQGDIIAVLTLRIDPSFDFTRVVQLGRIGKSGEIYAFDDRAMLITNSRFEGQLHELGLIDSRNSSMLSLRIADPGGNMLEGYIPSQPRHKLPLTFMAQSALNGETSDNLIGYRDYRGVPVFGSWHWDKTLGFGIATEIDVAEALIPFYKTRNIIIVAILSIILILFTGFYIWMVIEKKAKKELNEAHGQLEGIVEERTKELQVLSYQDSLTNIANRRKFEEAYALEWHRALRDKTELSLLMIDIDEFKSYNDNYGHVKGDRCLQKVAQLIDNISQRKTDLVARYGGEEFVVLLPNTAKAQAKVFAEKCRETVAAENIEHHHSTTSYISISIGVSSSIPSPDLSPSWLLKDADKQLYLAKQNGRNRVE